MWNNLFFLNEADDEDEKKKNDEKEDKKEKIYYLKTIGDILNKLDNIRKYSELKDLYISLNGDLWESNYNWNEDDPC